MTLATLLLISDGRFPSGAHAHSGGIEQAVEFGMVTDVDTLADFLAHRLATSGLVAAHIAATSCHHALWLDPSLDGPLDCFWRALDVEVDARLPSPSLRLTSRRQGAQLLRAAVAVSSHRVLSAVRRTGGPLGPHLSVVTGAQSAALGLTPHDAALASAYPVVVGPAGAALRLLGLDPLAVTASLLALMPDVDKLATAAAATALNSIDQLPALSSPGLDLLAAAHAERRDHLFAS
jgi:urease accessory protein